MTTNANSQPADSNDGESPEIAEETRRLDQLVPYPDQHVYFGDLNDAHLQDLISDIRLRGLMNPPEVLPENSAGFAENTILLGHQRVRALRELGYDQWEVIIRYDLADASREQIEREFLMDNHARRHMSKLAIARVAKRLIEIERASRKSESANGERKTRQRPLGTEVRDVIGKRFGISGRTLDRWMHVLDLPIEIQQAADRGSLPMTKAAKLASEGKSIIQKVATAIGKGEDPKKAVARYTAKPKQSDVASRAVRDLMKTLDRANNELPKQLDAFCSTPYRNDYKVLEDARKLLKDIECKLQKNETANVRRMKKLTDEFFDG